jgi:hypothetical protein
MLPGGTLAAARTDLTSPSTSAAACSFALRRRQPSPVGSDEEFDGVVGLFDRDGMPLMVVGLNRGRHPDLVRTVTVTAAEHQRRADQHGVQATACQTGLAPTSAREMHAVHRRLPQSRSQSRMNP